MKGSKALSIVLTLALVLTLLPIGALTAGAAAVAEVQLSGTPTILPNGQTTTETYNVNFKIDPVNQRTDTQSLSYIPDNTNPLNLTAGKTYTVEYDSTNTIWTLKDGATVVATSNDGRVFTDTNGNSGTFSAALQTTAYELTMNNTAASATVVYTTSAASRAVLNVVDSNGKFFEFQASNDAKGNATVNPANTPVRSVTLTTNASAAGSVEFTIPIRVTSGQEGTGSLYLKITPDSSQDQFPNTTVELAKFEAAKATVSVVSGSKSFGESGLGVLTNPVEFQISEPVAGTLQANDEIKISLPDGFKWVGPAIGTSILGPNPNTGMSVSGDGTKDITIKVRNASNSSTGRYVFTVKAGISVNTQVARKGDVIVAVGGATPSTLTIGRYGDYQVIVSGEPEDVWAGRFLETGKIAGKIVLDEMLPKSLIDGRTVVLTLPEGSEWPVVDRNGKTITETNFDPNNVDSTASKNKIFYFPTSNKQDFDSVEFETIDGDFRIAKLKVKNKLNPQAGKTVIEVRQIAVSLGFKEGPLTVEVSGTAGASGKATLANVKSLFTFSVENKRDVVIGARNQVIGDIVIKETVPGALRGGYDIALTGERYLTEFTDVTEVVVRSGDVEIGSSSISSDGKKYNFPVKHASTQASEVVLKGIKLTLDRTSPEGDLKVKIGGPAVSDYGSKSVYPATVVTPADKTQRVTAKFTIDSVTYVVNGESKAMDVAPFIKDNRTFVPVKYVAEALGVKESDIIWNPYAKSVTIFKGDRVIQLKIGSKTLVVNGSALEMDTAAMIKDARTVLPIAWVAKALGVEYTWNDAERSVEFNYLAQ